MLVNCENCDTNFNLDESLVKTSGSKVRCSKCKHIFVVYPPRPAEDDLPDDVGLDDEEMSQDMSGEFGPAGDQDLDADASEDVPGLGESLFDEAAADEVEADDLDLSDIEKMLAAEEEPEAAADTGLPQEDAGNGPEADSLDLSDIEKILDEEDDGDEMLEDKIEEDEDLVFDLDESLDLDAGEDQLSPTTDLDLGDLEKMFEAEEDASDLTFGEDASLSLELETGDDEEAMFPDSEELDFDMETESPALEMEESSETLDFDMEPATHETPTLDIDFEDEEDTPIDAGSAGVAGLDFDLEMEESAVPETAALDISEEDVAEIVDVDDLFAAEEAADGALGTTPEDQEIDGILAEALEQEADEDGLMAFGEEADMDFPDEAVPDIPDEDESDGEGAFDREATLEAEDDFEEISPAATSKRGGKKIVIGLLVVILVLVLAYAALALLQYKGIQVPYLDQVQLPFLGKLSSSERLDSGNLKIITSDVDSRFMDSDKAGRLFIVTGKVKNEYSQPRSFIQVSGSLYTRGKLLADTATAYCGNVIADMELSQMVPAAIRTRLGNRSGENNTNVGIKPGEERSFMIVFFELPESLEEFTVAVIGSSAEGK